MKFQDGDRSEFSAAALVQCMMPRAFQSPKMRPFLSRAANTMHSSCLQMEILGNGSRSDEGAAIFERQQVGHTYIARGINLFSLQ